jgi:putative heme-binding domain-containing protein
MLVSISAAASRAIGLRPPLFRFAMVGCCFTALWLVRPAFALGQHFATAAAPVSPASSDATAGPPVTPHWLWTLAPGHVRGTSLKVQKQFTLPTGCSGGSLKLAADFCTVRVVVNDQVVARCAPFSPTLSLDIQHVLQAGANTVRIEAEAIPGPAGVAASITVLEKSGLQRTVLTDDSWTLLEATAMTLQDRGAVLPELWGAGQRSIDLSAADNYEQWRQALRSEPTAAATSTRAPQFQLPPGTQLQLLKAAAADEGSWVSMAFDPEGRLTIAREDQGLFRLTLQGSTPEVSTPEIINADLLECRGLLYAHGALYASANNSRALVRLRDTDQNGSLDEVQTLREFPGGLGHGRNDLALAPDGWIYAIQGDSVEMPEQAVRDLTSPLRDSRRGPRQQEGRLIRTNPEGTQWELVSTGLRNPYGIDVNAAGDVFTWDADNEYDMDTPWYRPTRLWHLFAGADFGWRITQGQWPPYYPDQADMATAVMDLGKGSPTSVMFGTGLRAPEKYRRALYVLDWAYGRILAVHLRPRGASYRGEAELLLQGRPLNVTDVACGPDGAMYLITGGRKTQSALYRLTWTGAAGADSNSAPATERDPSEGVSTGNHEQEQEAYAAAQRVIRQTLDTELRQPVTEDSLAQRLELAFQQLPSADPVLRAQAVVLLEQTPAAAWIERAFALSDRMGFETAAMSLLKLADPQVTSRVLRRVFMEEPAKLAVATKAGSVEEEGASGDSDDSPDALRSLFIRLQLATQLAEDSQPLFAEWRQRLVADLARRLGRLTGSTRLTGPGLDGRAVIRHVVTAMGEWQEDAGISAALVLLQSVDQRDQLAGLLALRGQLSQLSVEQQRLYLTVLNRGVDFTGGDGMPVFLKRVREDALAGLSESERQSLGTLLQETPQAQEDAVPARSLVRQWVLADLEPLLSADAERGDPERGAVVFREALCVRCHRVGASGPAVGPDLSFVARRFSRRDICESVLNPSAVVAEPYRLTQITTTAGTVVTGRILTGGDFRSELIRVNTDPLRLSMVQDVDRKEIEDVRTLEQSPMPAGLFDVLTLEEIRDLLAWLEG